METKKSPNFVTMYQRLDEGVDPTLAGDVIDGAGTCFTIGTVGGSLYHFAKALCKEKKLISGVNAARAFGPRIGGTFALVSLPIDATGYALYRLGGGGPRYADSSRLGNIASLAAFGALLWAPRGLGSAFRAALVWASVPTAVEFLHIFNENAHVFNPQRPYYYPHYRIHQQQEEQDN